MLGSVQCDYYGIWFTSQRVHYCRCLLALIEFDGSDGFAPNSVDIVIMVAGEKVIVHSTISFAQPYVAVASLYARQQKQDKTLPARVYIGLLEGLKALLDGNTVYRPDISATHWFHGAILSFVRKFVHSYESVGFDLFQALSCLSDLFEARKLPSWLILVSIGHVVGTLQPSSQACSRQRFLELKRIRSLWKVPQHVLRTRFDSIRETSKALNVASAAARVRKADSAEFASLNCLAGRTALFFLCNEDASTNGYFPTYSPFAGCVPLINLLGMQSKGTFSIQYVLIYGVAMCDVLVTCVVVQIPRDGLLNSVAQRLERQVSVRYLPYVCPVPCKH
jgi:hypothetical protein